MSQPEITVYGAYWCPDCHRSKQFLGEHQIPYEWVNIEEDSDGEQFVIEANEGKRRIPTLAFGDGSILSNPSSVPGIFAAGDIRAGSTKQVASATGEGAAAALMIREYLRSV